MSLIEVKNLDFSYNETKKVIKNISFDIKKGDYVTIIGHNGSGKSTLARLLIGLLEAKSGSIKIDGLELNEENVYKIREKIGIVFQNPDNQFIGSTVRDDIAFGLENHMIPQGDMDDIINKYAKEVGLEEFLDKEPTALSGGQKQRVAIAGVLAMNPDIIIFDEATSMLDPRGKKDIKDIMRKLHGDGSFTRDKNNKYTFSLEGTELFLNFIKEYLSLTYNVKFNTKLYKRYDTENCCYTLKASGKNNVIKILDLLYKNSNLYLERKYNKYLNITKL